jgi:hypothetical protein
VGGVPVDALLRDAVARWGPAFQDHLARQLLDLVAHRGGGTGPWLEIEVGGREDLRRLHRLATRTRWRRAQAHLEACRESAGPAQLGEVRRHRAGGLRSWGAGRLSPEEAAEDLALLQCQLATRLARPGAVWRAAMARARREVEQGIDRRGLALQVMKLLAGLGDGHARLRRGKSGLRLSDRVLPVRLVAVEEGVACLRADAPAFCAPACPLLAGLERVPAAELLGELSPLVPRVSPEFHRAELLALLVEVDLVSPARMFSRLGRRGASRSDEVRVDLTDGKGRACVWRARPTAPKDARPAARPVEARVLGSGHGYLGLRSGWPPGAAFADEVVAALGSLRGTPGLVLDVRGNAGGDRTAVLSLLAHLVPAASDPLVLDVAAYRMDRAKRLPPEFDVLAQRHLHPPRSPWFAGAARRAAEEAVARARRRWPLPSAEWSEWHVAVLDRPAGPWVYDRPVIVLVDEASASATQLLVATLAPLERVTIAGLAGGGGSGWPVDFRLPHSRLVLSLPTVFSVDAAGNARRAILPELRRPRTLADLRRELDGGSDPWLDWAVERLARPPGAPGLGADAVRAGAPR